jgi:hypothetical protein
MQHIHVLKIENGKVRIRTKAAKKNARQMLAHRLDQTLKIMN